MIVNYGVFMIVHCISLCLIIQNLLPSAEAESDILNHNEQTLKYDGDTE